VPRLIGTVYGACDVLALPIPLGSGVPKIGDYSVTTKFYGVGMVDGRVCFTDYDYGMVHITRNTITAQGSVAAGLKNPAGLLLIPEGAVMEPGTQLGTLVLVK
jgi:hypothetical protein